VSDNVLLECLHASCKFELYFQLVLTNEDEQGNYVIDGEAGEPDSHIVDLNGEIVNCDDVFSTSLPKKERQYVLYPIISKY
jgi:hypothetical protein